MRWKINRIISTLLLAPLLIACQPETISTPVHIAQTSASPQMGTSVEEPAPRPTVPTKTPRAQFDLEGYSLTYKGVTCPLKEVEFYGRYVIQVDCEEIIYLPQGTIITLALNTPQNETLPISPAADIAAVFGALEPPFLFCEFGSTKLPNTVTFGIPFQQTTGRDTLCAFSIPLQGEDVTIALTGLTSRRPSHPRSIQACTFFGMIANNIH